MRRFGELYERLDATTSTNAKVAHLRDYFAAAPPEDAAWALFFLTGRRIKRLLRSAELRDWTLHATGLPPWLLGECHAAVGDLAETLALLVHQGGEPLSTELPLHRWVEERLLPLRTMDEDARRQAVFRIWRELPPRELFLLHKMMTGELRVGVSRTLAVRALAELVGLPTATVSHRLMGDWRPSAEMFREVVHPGPIPADRSQPYPFYLAHPFEEDPAKLGELREWAFEWKWDGIRAQLLRRDGDVYLWSRGEEMVTERFPEIAEAAQQLPSGTVLDGEILSWKDGRALPFAALQRRIGRKRLTMRVLREVPVALMAFDLLELDGKDLREQPLDERRAHLERVLADVGSSRLLASPLVEVPDVETLENLRKGARAQGVEGLMIKRRGSPYGSGRRKGDWWKWKVDPLTVDVVLMTAQPGSGRRASVLTDYGFGVWDEGELTPIAKAYSGLTDAEIDEVDRWIRRHTVERHGPVRRVEPLQVFELGFEGIARSTRHRSGVALRFPRILRWRTDKPPEEANTLADVQELLALYGWTPEGPRPPTQLSLFDEGTDLSS